jgi:hypothetical protein
MAWHTLQQQQQQHMGHGIPACVPCNKCMLWRVWLATHMRTHASAAQTLPHLHSSPADPVKQAIVELLRWRLPMLPCTTAFTAAARLWPFPCPWSHCSVRLRVVKVVHPCRDPYTVMLLW